VNLKKHIQHPIFSIVSQAADELAYETYVIGGFVRDVILERTQPTDIDFVCVGSGIKLANKVSELLGKRY
jgi:tRNA nucleotidyltransferase (CCA-adding enzyme)